MHQDLFDNYMRQMEDVAMAYVKEKQARKRISTMQELATGLPAGVKAADVKIKENPAPREAEEAMRKLVMAYGRKEDIKEEGGEEKMSSVSSRLSNRYVNVSYLV
jgi:hypothetical protein